MIAQPPSRAALATLALAAALAFAQAAQACSCLSPASPAAQLQASQLAFRGRAIASRPAGGAGPAAVTETRFEVLEQWRGQPLRSIWIRHGTHSAACGVTFRPGQAVTIFSNRSPAAGGPYSTNLCSSARFSDEAYRRAARGGAGSGPPPVVG